MLPACRHGCAHWAGVLLLCTPVLKIVLDLYGQGDECSIVCVDGCKLRMCSLALGWEACGGEGALVADTPPASDARWGAWMHRLLQMQQALGTGAFQEVNKGALPAAL